MAHVFSIEQTSISSRSASLLISAVTQKNKLCPRVLGIDEHFFSRKQGFATTLCNLSNHTIFDIVKGRSELDLRDYLASLQGKERVKVVCMDLSSTYRSIVKKHFPNAKIVADRLALPQM